MNDMEERMVTAAVQVLPQHEDLYAVVDRAIEAIAQSGLRYLVCPMETTIEGTLDQVLSAAKAAHLACFEAGAEGVVTIIKIGDALGGSTIDDKLEKYR
jgi:uncharacterized protein YqgV (UPF0045/DUF77 family)